MIKAIIFDMNGIIIDDEHIHELAFRKTVEPFGIIPTHKNYLNCCAGRTDKEGYISISEEFSTPLPVNKLLKEKANIYLKLYPKHKKVFPGVLEVIYSLSKKYLLALTSSASWAEVKLITHEFSINKLFKVTISADDVKKGKPNPEPYLTTCKLIGLKPQECAVIEDSKNGILSAKSAGCLCIGLTTTHSKRDLEKADAVVNSFEEINSKLFTHLENHVPILRAYCKSRVCSRDSEQA